MTADQNSLLDYLKTMRELRRQNVNKHDFHYLGGEDFLLQHGEWFTHFARKPIYRGIERACYHNAIHAAMRKHVTYVEGYAAGIIPVNHCWCVDDGNTAHEVTWPKPGSLYFGVRFSYRRALRVAGRVRFYGVLSDPSDESVLRRPWAGEQWKRERR